MKNQPTRVQLFGSLDCGDVAVSCNGAVYNPDATKGYVECSFSHVWPVVTYYGECLSPETVRRSFSSVLHQPVNREHRMRIHDPEKKAPDEVIGCIVSAECGIHSGAALPDSVESSPGIRAVAAIFKQANGVDKIIGQHQSGRHRMTVSMEVIYSPAESGFIMRGEDPGEDELQWTPEPWRRQGLMYVPAEHADSDLVDTRDWARLRMRDMKAGGKGYFGRLRRGKKEREVYFMMGGLVGAVHYSGLAIVKAGAEPTAQITQMLAHVPEEESVANLIGSIGSAVDNYFRQDDKKY